MDLRRILSVHTSTLLVTASLLAVPGCGGEPDEGTPLTTAIQEFKKPNKPKGHPPVFDISIDTVRQKIMNWGFPAGAFVTDPYFSDFWGAQRLSDDLTREKVLQDLVPAHAQVVAAPANDVLRLQFTEGWYADFYFGGTLRFNQSTDKLAPTLNFAAVQNANTTDDERPFVAKFRALLAQENLEPAYLKANPNFAEEQLALSVLQAGGTNPADELGGFDAFLQEENAIYLVPDAVHGDPVRYAVLVDLLEAPEVDWIGIEMIDLTMQDELDVFVQGKKHNKDYKEAEAAILAFYEVGWDDTFGEDVKPKDNPYFKLLEMARDSHKGAYGLDSDGDYLVFRYSEFPIGATTRNIIWAQQMPGEGRGLVFGGSGHMIRGMVGNVQQFVRDIHPDTAIYHYYVDHAP